MAFDIWKDPKPWMTDGLVGWLEQNVRPSDRVLEFGGGASTMWWAERSAFTYTLEAAPHWAPLLIEKMAARPDLLAKWSMGFIPCEWSVGLNSPKEYWKANRAHLSDEQAETMMLAYEVIPSWLNPDIIVIDGSIRPRTVVTTAAYARDRDVRLIVVDNMETMDRYARGAFDGYEELPFHEYDLTKIPVHQNGKWCSSVFVRA
jgi:hypothetical protein